jgi:Flp pilus assembly protein TadD
VAAYRRAVELDPDYADGWFNLGNGLRLSEDLEGAEAAFRRSLELAPSARALQNLGAVLVRREELAEAESCFERLLREEPEHPGALNNLAAIHFARGDTAGALTCFHRALAARPEFTPAHVNLGLHHGRRGELAEAIDAYRGAAAAQPSTYYVHLNLGLTMLLAGLFEDGWREYEWRWRRRGRAAEKRGFDQPLWDGSPLAGESVLLTAEQGLGDMIQFVRYAELVRRRGGVPWAEARPPLRRLFASCDALEGVIVERRGESGEILGGPHPQAHRFDLQTPLLTLPRLFATDLDSIPARVPYLGAAPALSDEVEARLAAAGDALRVGVVWAGNPSNGMDARRSCPLEHWRPLAAVPGVHLFSLQFGERGRELEEHPELGMTDLGPLLGDFYATAAVVRRLDLVVTVDTSMAHLAGALGHPTWTLLAFVPDWRWLMERDDSPWYPSMRLFRQPREGAWGEVMTRVAAELSRRAAARPL